MYKAIETYRGLVNTWTIDHVGHMNVQFYTARFDEASWQFLGRIGLSPSYLKRNGRAAVAADKRTEYKQEVVAGSLVHITTELLVVGTKSMRVMHRMYDSETYAEIAAMELVGVYFDTSRRAPVDLPEIVHERVQTLLVTGEMIGVGQLSRQSGVPFPAVQARQSRTSGSGVHFRPSSRAHSAADDSGHPIE